jgi:hypothetical protein
MRRRLVSLAVVLLAVAACDATVSSPSPTVPPEASAPPPSVDAGVGLLTGPSRPASVPVDPNLVTAIEFVCKNPADTNLKAIIEDVPVALVDARGDSLVSLILADEHQAYECRVSVEVLGGVPTATILVPPTRLDPDATLPVEDGTIRVVSHNRVDEDTGSRTILIGRVGSDAARVVAGFPDESEVEASMADGWYYAWWPGPDEPNSIAAVDRQSIAIAGVDEPQAEVQGRVGPASWWVDPAAVPLSPDATSIPALISEIACASGQPPEGRVLEPQVFSSEQAVLVNVWIRQQLTGQDCPSNPVVPLEITLPEPLDGRQLLDGSEVPPRDAAAPAD